MTERNIAADIREGFESLVRKSGREPLRDPSNPDAYLDDGGSLLNPMWDGWRAACEEMGLTVWVPYEGGDLLDAGEYAVSVLDGVTGKTRLRIARHERIAVQGPDGRSEKGVWLGMGSDVVLEWCRLPPHRSEPTVDQQLEAQLRRVTSIMMQPADSSDASFPRLTNAQWESLYEG